MGGIGQRACGASLKDLRARYASRFWWLDSVADAGRVGCVVCALHCPEWRKCKWAQYRITGAVLRTFTLQQHSISKAHKLAILKSEGQELSGDAMGHPAAEDFQKVLKIFANNAGGRANMDDVMGRKKMDKVAWCLAEAVRDVIRNNLRKALVMAVHQDSGNGRHCVYATTVGPDLRVTSQLLGYTTCGTATGSDAIVDMDKVIVDSICTKRSGAPAGVKANPRLDKRLKSHVCNSVVLFDADAASDEQRAGRQLSFELFPNVRFRLKDKTHASRRLVSKPWEACPFISDAFNTVIQGFDSVTRLIENSASIKIIFNKYCKQNETDDFDSSAVRSLSYSKDRFDSCSTPTRRFILCLDAIIATCVELVHSRGGRPANRAEAFLRWLTAAEGPERVLQLGMLADAFDECMAVTRALDTSGFDVAEVPAVLENFSVHLDVLFKNNGAKVTGLTKKAIDSLAKERAICFKGARLRLGGPNAVTDDVYNRCNGRMLSMSQPQPVSDFRVRSAGLRSGMQRVSNLDVRPALHSGWVLRPTCFLSSTDHACVWKLFLSEDTLCSKCCLRVGLNAVLGEGHFKDMAALRSMSGMRVRGVCVLKQLKLRSGSLLSCISGAISSTRACARSSRCGRRGPTSISLTSES